MDVVKDRGYAWIVAVASTVVMFVGPSTYSSSGLFFAKVEMTNEQQIWISQVTYVLWCFVAIIAGPLAYLYTHRRVVMISCFIAACGLSVTAITLMNPQLSFFTFSTLVGITMGLATHTTFLLVTSHFHRHRGIAIGIGAFSAGIGQAVAPFICLRPLMEPKNIFFIRALMTAVAFMTASLYISPTTIKGVRRLSNESNNSERPSTSIKIKATTTEKMKEDNAPVVTLIVPRTKIKPVGIAKKPFQSYEHTMPTMNLKLKAKKSQSQLLAGISANILPNISEESEHSPFLQRKEIKPFQQQDDEESKWIPDWTSIPERKPLDLQKKKEIDMNLANKFCIKPIDAELEKKISKTIEKFKNSDINKSSSSKVKWKKSLSPESLSPNLMKRISQAHSKSKPIPTVTSQTLHLYPNKHFGVEPLPPDLIAKLSRQFQSGSGERAKPSLQNHNSNRINNFRPTTLSLTKSEAQKNMTPFATTTSTNQNTHESQVKYIPLWRELYDRIELRFLINFRFLNICIPSVLSILFVQNFPIIFSSYITALQLKKYHGSDNGNGSQSSSDLDLNHAPHFQHTSIGLHLIFILDMITRLGMAYLSDLTFFSRRWGFLLGSTGSVIICLAICTVEDMVTIHIFCAVFGVCFGTMMVTESLMLVEAFGIKKLSSCYGLMNVIKVVFVLLFYPIQSPILTFMYNFHPIKSTQVLNGTSEFRDFDPLGLFFNIDDSERTLNTSRNWLRILSAPGILLLILWTLELILDRHFKSFGYFRTYSNSKRNKSQSLKGNSLGLSNSNPTLSSTEPEKMLP